MALIGSIAINMKVMTKSFGKGLAGATKLLNAFERKVVSVAGAMAGIGGVASFAGGVLSIKSMINAASDLNETMSKTSAVFGADAGSVIAEADKMADAFGTSKNEFLSSASALGGLFKGAGFDSAAAAKMSTDFTKLAADVSSFANLPFDQAFDKIRAGLTGESEPLKSLGILMNEASVKAEAMRLGLSSGGKELSEQAKVQARASLITKGFADAQGDLAKTSGGVANSSRALFGRIENLSASLGQVFLPIAQQALYALNGFAKSITGLIEASKPMIAGWIDSAAGMWDTFITGAGAVAGKVGELMGKFDGLGSTVGWLSGLSDAIGFAWRNLPAIFEVAALQIQEKFINLGEYAQTIPANLGIIADWISQNWVTLVTDAVNAVATVFQNLGKNLWNLGSAIGTFLADPTRGFEFDWTPMLSGFKAQTAKLPDLIKPSLTSLQSEIDAKLGAIGKTEAERTARLAKSAQERAKLAATAISPPGGPSSPGASAKPGAGEAKFASAVVAGTRESTNAIMRGVYGPAVGKGPADQTAKNTKDTADGVKKVAELLGRAVGAGVAGVAGGGPKTATPAAGAWTF